jgi:predicted nucleotidyltransferase
METKEKSYADQIEATVETISTHIEKKSGTGLSTTINKWIDVLEDHKDLKTIASNLKKLKTAIDDKDVKKAVTLMETLGEQTKDAAEMAEGSEATKIKSLGKALTSGSKAIAKFM